MVGVFGRAPSQGLVPTFGPVCVYTATESGCRLMGDGTSADQNSQSAGGLGAKQDPGLTRVLPILELLNERTGQLFILLQPVVDLSGNAQHSIRPLAPEIDGDFDVV